MPVRKLAYVNEIGGNSSARRRKMAVGPSGAVVGEPMNNLVAGIGEVLGENKQMDKKSNSAKIPPRSMNLDYITNPFTDESIELFFKKSEVSIALAKFTKYTEFFRHQGFSESDVEKWVSNNEQKT